MKLFLAAIALAVASPAIAQTATTDPHAGHSMAQSAPAADSCTPEHAAMGHCTPAKAAPAADPHAGHDMKGDGKMTCCEKGADGKMACCAKMKAAGKTMDCCAKMGGKATKAQSGHSGH